MTKNTPRIFISLLLMLLCIGILPVSAFASDGDYPDDALPTAKSSAADAQETKQIGTVTTNGGNLNVRTGAGLDNTAFTQLPNGTVVDVIGRDGDWVKILLPARVGYVYGSYLTVTDAADSTVSIGGITLPFDEKELADLWQLLVGSMTGGSDALTPDGNLTLIDDIGTSTKAGKQFITLESKNGNTFYLIIDRDDEGEETVHFLNQVDEADLMALTGEEETPATCSCTTKCVAGTVNTSCPVCAVNMTECVGKEAKAPALYDLTSLQRDANRVLGYTSQQTLDYLQALYEKKLCTYPRTDSRYLTDDMEGSVPGLVAAAAAVCGMEKPPTICAKQVCSSKKVTDHHAIVPTISAEKVDMASLPLGEREVLKLAARGLLRAADEPHRYAETVITVDCAGQSFTAKGKTVLAPGWKRYEQEQAEAAPALPVVTENQTLSVSAASVKTGKTTPPNLKP